MRAFIWEYAYATRADDRKTLTQDVDYGLKCKTEEWKVPWVGPSSYNRCGCIKH
jgi:hypothetical protein